jgi:hypothetical protein
MRKRIFLKGLAAAAAAGAHAAVSAVAAGAAVQGATPVILSLRGKVRGGSVDFDARALAALGTATVRTRTQWLAEPATWSGVPLARVLASVDAAGQTLRMRALNDYSVTVPVADVPRYAPILAGKMDGKVLGVRERGPLIVIYPFDSFPEINTQVFYDRAVWQLREITVD